MAGDGARGTDMKWKQRFWGLLSLFYCTKKGIGIKWRGGEKEDSEDFSEDNWGLNDPSPKVQEVWANIAAKRGGVSHNATDLLVEIMRDRPQRVKLVCAAVFLGTVAICCLLIVAAFIVRGML